MSSGDGLSGDGLGRDGPGHDAPGQGGSGGGFPPGRRRTYGFELPLLLFAGFREIIDELHRQLAERGHPDMRPAHGFALQAIGADGATATEVGRRLGISKQAAGKTVDRLEELGYVYRAEDDADRRRKLIRLTPRGVEALTLSAMIFEEIRARWERELGADQLDSVEQSLRTMAPGQFFRLDVPGWFSP